MRSGRCASVLLFRLSRVSRRAVGLGIVATLAFPFSGCNKTWEPLAGPAQAYSSLRVSVQNSCFAEISISYQGGTAQAVPMGQTVYPFIYYSSVGALPSSDWFYVQRQSVSLARVSYRPLHFPDKLGDLKDTKIVISEPSPGLFAATAAEPDWIQILSVTPLP